MSQDRPTISTHVLDTAAGSPRAGVRRPAAAARPRTAARRSSARESPTRTAGSATSSAARRSSRRRLPSRVRASPRTGSSARLALDFRDRRHRPQLSRAAAARAVRPHDVPRLLTARDRHARRTSRRARCARRTGAVVAALVPLFEGAPSFLARLCAEPAVRRPARPVRSRPRHRAGDARARAARAHRRPPAPRRAARVRVGSLSFVEQGYDRGRSARRGRRPTPSGADRGRARAPQRRLRGSLRVPLLRLRGRPAAGRAAAGVRGRARGVRETRRSRGRSTLSSTSPRTATGSSSSSTRCLRSICL